MKKLKIELKDKSIVELEKEANVLREQIGRFNLEQKVRPQKDTNIINTKRKTLALVLTLINQKRDLELLQQQ